MKRLFAALCAAALCVCALAGCTASHSTQSAGNGGDAGSAASGAAAPGADGRLSIVTTIYPEYDWVLQILGDAAAGADVTLLLDNGTDLHSYQPSAQDIRTIADADVFVYVGGESDEWVDDVLAQSGNEDMKVVNLLDTLGSSVKEEEVVEGMQAEAEEGGEHEGHVHADGGADADAPDAAEGEGASAAAEGGATLAAGEDAEAEACPEYDEHVWLSLKNAMVLCDAITGQLSAADPGNAQTYAANAEAYIAQLSALDKEYQAAVDGAAVDAVLFADRFPYRYLVDDYGLSYYAAFVGCSAETEASFETVAYLANKVDELGLTHVLVNKGSDEKIARAVIAATQAQDQEILVMDPMETTVADDAAGNATARTAGSAGYLSIMQANLDVLRTALS